MDEIITVQDETAKGIPIFLGNLPHESNVYLNVSENYIVITEDKLRIQLSKHLKDVEQTGRWIAPLGIFLTLILSLITTNFKEFGLKASSWETIFIIAAFVSFVWVGYSLWRHPKSNTLDQLIEFIKKEQK